MQTSSSSSSTSSRDRRSSLLTYSSGTHSRSRLSQYASSTTTSRGTSSTYISSTQSYAMSDVQSVSSMNSISRTISNCGSTATSRGYSTFGGDTRSLFVSSSRYNSIPSYTSRSRSCTSRSRYANSVPISRRRGYYSLKLTLMELVLN